MADILRKHSNLSLFFQLKEQNYTKNIPSKQMEVINNNEEDSQVGYVVMGPEIHLSESEEQQYGYMEMSGPENHETGKLDIKY